MYLCYENYSERGHPLGATTEIINKPLNHNFRGFYISTRIAHGLLYNVPLKKSALHRVDSNLMEFCNGIFSLAIEINLDFVIWHVRIGSSFTANVLAMHSVGFQSPYISAYSDVYFMFIFSNLLQNPTLCMSLCCGVVIFLHQVYTRFLFLFQYS